MAFQLDAFQPDAFQTGVTATRPTVAHNGGRSQLVLGFPGSGFYPFLNHALDSEGWTYTATNLPVKPSDRNSIGFPTVTGVGAGFQLPAAADRPGNYVVRWTGTATFANYLHGLTVVSGSLSGTDGRAVITPSRADGLIGLQITSNSGVTSFAVVHVDDEADWEADPYGFGKEFLRRLNEGRIGVLRMLDLQKINTSMVQSWGQRRAQDCWSYREFEYRNSLYAGTTTNSGNAYSASLTGFSLVDKATVIVTFNADATSDSCTLNIESTGAKSIKDFGGRTFINSNYRPKASRTATLCYDQGLDCWMKVAGDSVSFDAGLDNGWPIEIMVKLCNEVGMHPWLHVPYLASESDYPTELANYLNGYLGSGLIPRIEYANEVWNTAAGFYQTPYAATKGGSVWPSLTSDVKRINNWYGRSTSKVGEGFSGTYVGDYHQIAAFQTHSDPYDRDRLLAPKYVEDGGTSALTYATHLTIANYWNTSYTAQEELDAAFEYASTGDGDIPDDYVSRDQGTNLGSGTINLARLYEVIALYKTRADDDGLLLNFYEGGWTPDYPLSGTNPVNYTLRLTAISKATQAVCSVFNGVGGEVVPPAGASISFSGVPGMTELNGNTYTVVARDLVARTFTLNVDSTGFGTYTDSGDKPATVVNSGQYRVNLREASKYAPSLRPLSLEHLEQCVALGGEFPSDYVFSGRDNAWYIFDPNLYATPSTRWAATVEFNNPVTQTVTVGGGVRSRRRRFVLPDDTVVDATLEELESLIEEYAEPVRPKKKSRKVLRLPEIDITQVEFKPGGDYDVVILPKQYSVDGKQVKAALQVLQDEEDFLLMIA